MKKLIFFVPVLAVILLTGCVLMPSGNNSRNNNGNIADTTTSWNFITGKTGSKTVMTRVDGNYSAGVNIGMDKYASISVLSEIKSKASRDLLNGAKNLLFDGTNSTPPGYSCAFEYNSDYYMLFGYSQGIFKLYKYSSEDDTNVYFTSSSLWDFSQVSNIINSAPYNSMQTPWILCPTYNDARKTFYFTLCYWVHNTVKGDYIKIRIYESKLQGSAFGPASELRGTINPFHPIHYLNGQWHSENDFSGRGGLWWVGRMYVTQDGKKVYFNCMNLNGDNTVMKQTSPFIPPLPNANDLAGSGISDMFDPRMIRTYVCSADILDDGTLTNVRQLPSSINRGGVNFVCDISPDGSTLYIAHMNMDAAGWAALWAAGWGPDGLVLQCCQQLASDVQYWNGTIEAMSSIVPTGSLTLELLFDGYIADTSGFNQPFTVNGTVLTNDRNNNPKNASYFNGVSDYITIPDLRNTASFTYSCWYYYISNTGNWDRLLYFGKDSDNNISLHIRNQGGAYLQYWYNYNNNLASSVISSTVMQTNQWYHIALVVDSQAKTSSLYINGNLDASSAWALDHTPADLGACSENYIGRIGNDYLKGILDDIRFYNRALNSSEIAKLWGGPVTTNGSDSRLPDIPDDQLVHNGNPNNYNVYILTGDSLSNESVTVNNLAVDTSTVGSISASVQNILNSKNTLTVVSETYSPSPDYVIDYTGPAKQVSDTYYGVNIQIISHRFFTLPKYKELIRNIKVDIARFPGGQEKVRYDRNDPSSDNDELGTNGPYQFKLTGGDVSNYIALCRELNIQAEPEVNLYNDNVDMESNMIDQIVNGLGYDLKYISAGNEPDNDTANYIDVYKRYFQAIRAVKPDVSFAFSELCSWDNPDLNNYLDNMLGQLSGCNPGALSVHWYMLGDHGQDPNSPDYPSIEHLVIRNNSHIEISYLSNIYLTMKQKRDQYIPGSKLFIGEFNACWSATPASVVIQDSLATAIYTAEVFEYGKKLGFDSMQYFSLSDPLEWDLWKPALIAVKNDYDTMVVRPQYYVRMFYKYVCGDKFVDIADNQKDDYSIYASKDNNYNYLMLINRTEDKNYKMYTRVITQQGTKCLKLILPKHSVTAIKF